MFTARDGGACVRVCVSCCCCVCVFACESDSRAVCVVRVCVSVCVRVGLRWTALDDARCISCVMCGIVDFSVSAFEIIRIISVVEYPWNVNPCSR